MIRMTPTPVLIVYLILAGGLALLMHFYPVGHP